jgi:hypothetical protein
MRQLIRLHHRTYMDTQLSKFSVNAKHVDLQTFPLSPRCLRAQRFRANGSHDSQLPNCPRTDPGVQFSRTRLFKYTRFRHPAY